MKALAIVATLFVAQAALGQADPAADHYKSGVSYFKAGRYSEAVQEFRAADAIRPSAVLSFNIAQCFEKMADLQNAKAAYQDYLRRAPNADDRAAIEATITSIDQKLAEKQQDTVVLVPPPTSEAASAAVTAPAPRSPPNYTLGIVTGAVGVAGLVAAVILNGVASQNSQSLANNGLNGHYFPQSQMNDYYNTASSTWTGAIIGYIAGGVLTAAGAGLLGYQYFSRPTSP